MTAQHTISIYEILYPVIKSEAKTKELVGFYREGSGSEV
jgi:hypothetical protein